MKAAAIYHQTNSKFKKELVAFSNGTMPEERLFAARKQQKLINDKGMLAWMHNTGKVEEKANEVWKMSDLFKIVDSVHSEFKLYLRPCNLL